MPSLHSFPGSNHHLSSYLTNSLIFILINSLIGFVVNRVLFSKQWREEQEVRIDDDPISRITCQKQSTSPTQPETCSSRFVPFF